MSTQVKADANEQIALLLGWERFEDREFDGFDGRYSGYHRGREWMTDSVPDYTQWDRFPELQEYVRGLHISLWCAVSREVAAVIPPDGNGCSGDSLMPQHVLGAVQAITPTILRDAILEVCDE